MIGVPEMTFISDLFSNATIGQIAKGVSAGILVMLGGAWTWIWFHFNPQFDYTAKPSDLSSQPVGLAEILSRIEKDTHVYCTGGLDQRLARIGLRTCYRFTFKPATTYDMTVCTHDQRTGQISTSDQFQALNYFEKRYTPRECFRSVALVGEEHAFEIVPGKDSHFRSIQYLNQPAQDAAFCGCSENEEKEIARMSGATLP